MQKVIGGVLTSLLLAAIPAIAQASSIHECGDTTRVGNITTRNVSCHVARHVAQMLTARGVPNHLVDSGWIRLPGWSPYRVTVYAT